MISHAGWQNEKLCKFCSYHLLYLPWNRRFSDRDVQNELWSKKKVSENKWFVSGAPDIPTAGDKS